MGLVISEPPARQRDKRDDYELVEESSVHAPGSGKCRPALVCEGISPEHEEMLGTTWRRKTRYLEAGDYKISPV